MKQKWETLKGKTYPDTLDEQLAALEQDEDVLLVGRKREQFASDPFRPLYHYSAFTSFGDANGLCNWQDKYHLFYQFTPEGQERVHWGHCYTDDFSQWHDLPPALYPSTELSVYSGQTVVEDDRVVAAYCGKGSGNGVATASDPLLLNWKKNPNNPVIPAPDVPEHQDPDGGFFDNCIWKEDDGYYSLSGTVIGKGGLRERLKTAEYLFYSKDLDHWEYLHPLLEDGFFCEPGEDGAVPNFWPIGMGKHMLLLFSHKLGSRYYIGVYDRRSRRFTPEYHGRITHGPCQGGIHCPSATVDAKGRYLAMFNCSEGRFEHECEWFGCMTLPWHLSLKADGLLAMEPVEELQKLRFNHQKVDPQALVPNSETVLDSVQGKSLEIDMTLNLGTAREAGLTVLRSPDGMEQTKISIFNVNHPKTNDMLHVDTSQSSLRTDVIGRPPIAAPFYLSEEKTVRLRIFVDRSIVEVFADTLQVDPRWAFPRDGIGNSKIFPLFPRQATAVRVYPDRDDSRGISLFARGGEAHIVSMDVWHMRSTWPELKHREGE